MTNENEIKRIKREKDIHLLLLLNRTGIILTFHFLKLTLMNMNV